MLFQSRILLLLTMVLLIKLIRESFLFAISSLVNNRLRTFLSLMGVTIGIFAIISVFTVLDSIERNIKDSIASLGDDVVYVQKWPWEFEGEYKWWKYLNRPLPKLKELEEIKRRAKGVEAGAFMVSTRKNISFEDKTMEGGIVIAASQSYDKIRSFELSKGRYFSPYESKSGRNNAIIGDDIVKNLFGSKEPIGKSIKISGRKVNVIGVFKREGQDLISNMSADNTILIPINFARSFIDIKSERNNPMIMLKAKEGITALDLTEEMAGIMRSIRRLKPMAEDDFALNRTSLLTKGFDSLFSTVKVVSGIIGGFAILVGAFGIANIMFVSVKERTRQIGIQKSLGAKNYFILLQFLYESVILCLIGGGLGLILIFVGAILASRLVEMELSLTMGNVITGIVISVVAGLISGSIPARMASKLNPVEAMNSVF